MCGVIDSDGQQWEHCNQCGKWVKIQNLKYEKPTPENPYGRDLCSRCATPAITKIQPGDSITILYRGYEYSGYINSAVNWGTVDKPDWYIEFTSSDGPHCWKQGCDGGEIVKVTRGG